VYATSPARDKNSRTEGGVGGQAARRDRACLDFLVLLHQGKRTSGIYGVAVKTMAVGQATNSGAKNK
jgi:hypothetical protein